MESKHRYWVVTSWIAMLVVLIHSPSPVGAEGYIPQSLYSNVSEISTSNNPYDRKPNFYGLNTPDHDNGLTKWVENLDIPIVTNLDIAAFHNDNVYMSNLQSKASFGSFINPSFLLPMRFGKHLAYFRYSFRASIYENASKNNYVDNYLEGSTTFDFNARNRLVLTALASYAHDPLGTLFSQGNIGTILNSPNEWNGYLFNALYQYGAVGAKGNIEFRFAYNNRVYTNNLELTRQRDVNSFGLGCTFFYRVMPKTRLLFEINNIIIDYLNKLNSGSSLDGNLYKAFTGFTWQATAKTKAVLKIGYQWRDFSDPSLQSKSGPAFEGVLSWSPDSNDILELEFAKTINETNLGSTTSVDAQRYEASWKHEWLARLSSSLSAILINQKYADSDTDTTSTGASLTVTYQFKSNINGRFSYNYVDRSSNQQQYDYTRNIVMLSMNISF